MRDGDFRMETTDFAAAVFGLAIRYGSGFGQVRIGHKNARVHLLMAVRWPDCPFLRRLIDFMVHVCFMVPSRR